MMVSSFRLKSNSERQNLLKYFLSSLKQKGPSPFCLAIWPYFILINHKNPSHEKLLFCAAIISFWVWYFYPFNLSGVKKSKKQAVGSWGTSQNSLIYLCFFVKMGGG